MKDINEYLLTKTVTVGELKDWIKNKDNLSKDRIIQLIDHRFKNRYIKHLKKIDSGFLKMAVACLTIEALESFKLGKKDTKGEGIDIFKSFFTTEELYFPGFKEISKDFYYNIRCGILHQAETKNAWRIIRSGKLLDNDEKVINASKFVTALNKSLDNYIKKLNEKDFDDILWKSALIKLEDICENCKVKPN